MAQRKARKESKGTGDFASFMASMKKDDALINLGEKEEIFYKIGDRNLDKALGGGFPAGQIYAFQGTPSSGKSLAALTLSKSVCDSDPEARVAYFDTENKISRKAIERVGLGEYEQEERFFHLSMDNLEDMIDRMVEFANTGFFRMIVIDSIDSLTTDEQEERDIHQGSKVGGYKAKVLSEHFPRVIAAAAQNDCSMLFVQQVRLNPGAMFANPEVTSGGEAIKFYVTTRLRFGPYKDLNQETDGKLSYQGASVRILKTNQGAVPKEPIMVRYYIGEDPDIPWGMDPLLSLADAALATRVFAATTPGGHNYAACDELCDALEIERGTLKYNGKKNLNAAITTDEEFRALVESIVDKREGLSKAELDALTGGNDEELEEDEEFEEIED